MLHALFGITPPDWSEKLPDQAILDLFSRSAAASEEEFEDMEIEDEEDDEAEEDQDEQ